jgi:hypothetical protein
MCEYVSVIATTEGSLQLYASPGLKSHGDARVGWNIKEGAEVEWTGEHHGTLTLRHHDSRTRKTVLQMIKDKYPTRTDLINSITETRGLNSSKLYYKNGSVVYCEETHGPKYKEIEQLLQDLPNFPWFKPVPNLDKENIVALVQEHITVLSKYGYTEKDISVKFIHTWEEYYAAWNAASDASMDAAWDVARDVAWDAASAVAWDDSYNAARDAARNVASVVSIEAARNAAIDAARNAAWNVARNAASDAASAVAWNAACLVADVDNPFSFLVEIYRLGCVPVGIVGKEFVVFIPPTKKP